MNTPSGSRRTQLRRMCTGMLALALATLAGTASSQDSWPSRPVRIVLPFPAGGASDALTRLLADKMSKQLGQPVVVDNRSGGGGVIGADIASKAAPDGYTVLFTLSDSQINAVALFNKLPYDPNRDFIPVTQLTISPVIFLASVDTPFANLRELAQYAKQNPGKLSYGSWGAGGLGHLIVESYSKTGGFELTHVPYRGEAPVVQDLLGKQIQLGVGAIPTAKPHLQKNTLKALAISGTRRDPSMPEVPTFLEQGFDTPVLRSQLWVGAFLPAKTPAPIVTRLHTVIRSVLGDPEVKVQLEARASTPGGNTPEEFAALIRAEFPVITRMISELNIPKQ